MLHHSLVFVPYRCCSSFSVQKVVSYYNGLAPEVIKQSSDAERTSSFRMIFPPPNVTGNLHIGHALTVVMEDSICRYQRRIGKAVEWVPGYDHAGIATQTVVERMLMKEKGISRHDISKEEFLKYCNEWKTTRQDAITQQLEKLGTSVDWNKAYYTMDDNFTNAVKHAFCQLHDDGFIFRDRREINWCPEMKSSISDQEVEYLTVDGSVQPVCSRTGAVIQRVLKDQWFLDCSTMNNAIVDQINTGKLNVCPNGNAQKMIDWLSYTDPWCLSRQLDWGHKIPAYLTKDGKWVVSKEPTDGTQDPDVLDTWFSSSLIPMIVQGWPHKKITEIPLNLMETGHDIIGFWVARMLALCHHLSGQLPFKNILLHGLVRDASGRKMSKSLGNVIDPLDVIEGKDAASLIDRIKASNLDKTEIEKAIKDVKDNFPNGLKASGADALRFAMLRHDLLAEDINMSLNELAQEGLRFCNKIWNLSKYANIVFSKVEPVVADVFSSHPVDLWLLARLKTTLEKLHMSLDADNDCASAAPHHAFTALRDFILLDLCDVYLETTKKAINSEASDFSTRKADVSATLLLVMKAMCAALEPFMPYVANHVGDHLPRESFRKLHLRELCLGLPENSEVQKQMDLTLAVVSAVRSLRSSLEIGKKIKLAGYLPMTASKSSSLFDELVADLANLELIPETQEKLMPVAIPGHDLPLMVQIDESQKPVLIEKLSYQLSKAREKLQQRQITRDQLQETLMDMQVSGQHKPQALNKLMKKISQAANSLEAVENEVDRINNIRERIKAVGQFR